MGNGFWPLPAFMVQGGGGVGEPGEARRAGGSGAVIAGAQGGAQGAGRRAARSAASGQGLRVSSEPGAGTLANHAERGECGQRVDLGVTLCGVSFPPISYPVNAWAG
jgi:hypothetical protein